METFQLLLFVLLTLPLSSFLLDKDKDCPKSPDKHLTCTNDYNQVITCVWDSAHSPRHADTGCMIHAERINSPYGYSNSCRLEPLDDSRPMLKKCSIVFERKRNVGVFQSFHQLNITLSCNTVTLLVIQYMPACHIKLNRLPKPEIQQQFDNFTTVSWTFLDLHQIKQFQLQWRREGQPWINRPTKGCESPCIVRLDEDHLIKGKRYEAHVRVQSSKYVSTWSDWSPTASWVSTIGRATPPPPPATDVAVGVLGTFGCVLVLAVLLVLFRTDKTTWIYIIKRIRGPPLPNPRKSFLKDVSFQNWVTPHLTSEIHSFLRPVEIVSVEVTSAVDAVERCGPEATLRGKMMNESSYESTSSSFSNPSYSHDPPPPAPVSSLTAGNLEACGADTPYGPVVCQGEDKDTDEDREKERGKEAELQSTGCNRTEPTTVIPAYEKAQKPQVERLRFQSLDSGVSSGEEISQESLEGDIINVTDEGPEDEAERDGRNDFVFLFGSNGGSIQVSSGYEQVQKLQADSADLPSLDSSTSCLGEEHAGQEEMTDTSTESTSLWFLPPAAHSSELACSPIPLPSNLPGEGVGPVLGHLSSHIKERITLMSSKGSVEPSGDGYMPVRQE